MGKQKIVVSGINLTSGGILSILRDCLGYLSELANDYEIIVLVNNKVLVEDISGNFSVREYPLSKKSWFLRCFYEYVYFYFLSKKIKPYLWLSLHDITANVKTEKMAVYCHNPSPFYHVKKEKLFLDKKFTLFTWFYKYLYKINIRKNTYVIVQQQWMREAFEKMYGISNIIVASPKLDRNLVKPGKKLVDTFIYPTFPRVFKNIEVIGEALRKIDDIGINVLVTIDGTENVYAKKIVQQYQHLKSISFIGLQSRDKVFEYYGAVEGLIFPSKLETWGLPMSEFVETKKTIFAANLPYAKETLAGYSDVTFFNASDSQELADLLKDFVQKKHCISKAAPVEYDQPYVKNWGDLFRILLK